MRSPRALVLIGVSFSIIPIVLGIVGIATSYWLSVKTVNTDNVLRQYGLFSCNNEFCASKYGFGTAQGLIIAGIVAITLGAVITLVLDMFIRIRWVQWLSQFFLYLGPTMIFIGLLLYAKYAFEDITLPASQIPETYLSLDYSLILVIVACLAGFLVAIYFAFVSGIGDHHSATDQKLHFVRATDERGQRF